MRACGDAACSLGLVGFRVTDKVRLGLVLGIVSVLGLAYFTFCYTSSPQKPASSLARILPICI